MSGDWDSRVADARKSFPAIATSGRHEALRDYETLGRVLRDVLRADIGREGRGRLPALDAAAGADVKLRQLLGDDHATVPFPEAFRALAAHRSRSHVANRTGISRTQVHRLLKGEIVPTNTEIEQVAKAFGKRPVYFVEYRTRLICSVLAEHLERSPETSVLWVNQLGLVG